MMLWTLAVLAACDTETTDSGQPYSGLCDDGQAAPTWYADGDGDGQQRHSGSGQPVGHDH